MLNCKIKGSFRLKEIRTTNPIAVGDIVEVEAGCEGSGVISAIRERRNYIIRRSSNLSKQAHIIGSNLDHALLIVTLARPVTSTIFIDRFLASAEAYRIPTSIVFNKMDAIVDPDDEAYLDALIRLYNSIGYDCYKTSAKNNIGVDEIRSLLSGKITLLSGHSGVGKSTLVNRLVKDKNVKTGLISEYHQKGMHTTTFSEMFELEGGGFIIDTPGIKGFGTIDFSVEEVAHYFPEIFRYSNECRFNNCSHRHEPGCAVLVNLENHNISQSRYLSYVNILDDSNENKYR